MSSCWRIDSISTVISSIVVSLGPRRAKHARSHGPTAPVNPGGSFLPKEAAGCAPRGEFVRQAAWSFDHRRSRKHEAEARRRRQEHGLPRCLLRRLKPARIPLQEAGPAFGRGLLLWPGFECTEI